jgi:hypothetical protein
MMSLLLAGQALSAQNSGMSSFPETHHARRLLVPAVMKAGARPNFVPRQVVRRAGAPPVAVRTEYQNDRSYTLFIPRSRDGFVVASPGTFIIRRRMNDGAVDQVKLFLQPHEGSFIRVRPGPGRSTVEMDLHLGGASFEQRVPVAMTMDRLLVAPFSELIAVTGASVDWSSAFPDVADPGYRDVERMVAQIREALPRLPDAEDGAMDHEGRLVSIETTRPMEQRPGFNCSGFAKWVVDGLVRPRHGSYLSVESLTTKHLGHRGTRWSDGYERELDPYFGLDWTRNLALHWEAVRSGEDVDLGSPEAMDVRSFSFARYREDIGYPVKQLNRLLYRLAVREPGTIYLGSLSRPLPERGNLRHHSHVVVLLPYFDRNGTFRTVVMERNVETGVTELRRRYPDDFIHLVRVATHGDFSPPTFAQP